VSKMVKRLLIFEILLLAVFLVCIVILTICELSRCSNLIRGRGIIILWANALVPVVS